MWRPRELHISWSLQPRLPRTFTSTIRPLFASTRSRSPPLLIVSSTTCAKALPSMLCRSLLDCVCFTVLPWSGVIEFLHNSKSFWLWSCFQIPAEGLIYFFLMIRWPVSNTVVSPMLACPLIFTHKLLTHFSSTLWQSWIILVAFSYKELIYQLALMADLS